MVQHYKGTTGYALLFLVLFFSVSFFTLILTGLSSMLGVQGAGKVAGGVIFATFWVSGFIVMQRFVCIEKRRPTISEGNLVGIKSVLYIFVPIICLALFIAFIGFLLSLFGIGGESSEAGKAAQSGNNTDQNQKAIGALLGVFTMMFLLYAAPFLNLALLSRIFAPKSKTA